MSAQQDITRFNQGPVVYLVDDDTDLCLVLERWLARQGFAVRTFHSPVTFLQSMGEATPGVVLLDLWMPEMDGFTLLKLLHERGLEWPILVLTASDTANDAFQAVRLGAYDYLVKPVDKEHLLSRVRNAVERLQLQERVARLESELDTQQSFHEIIGTSAGMQKVFPLAELEKQAILHALTVTEGNMELAAVKLKIGRATLYRRLASYEDVSLSDFKQKKSYA